MLDRRMHMNIWWICLSQCINVAYLQECQVNLPVLMTKVWSIRYLVGAFAVRYIFSCSSVSMLDLVIFGKSSEIFYFPWLCPVVPTKKSLSVLDGWTFPWFLFQLFDSSNCIFPNDLQVQCMQCNFCSDKFDPFLDLSLEILKADSLQRALQHFTARELLDGGQRQYQCQQCKQKVKATKRLTIDKAPHVLTIHLKRFGSHVPGQKIDKKIHYGPTLDLKHFVSDTYVSVSFSS